MKLMFSLITVLILGVTFSQGKKSAATSSASAQQPLTLAASLDREVTTIEKLMVDAAEAMPENKYNFSPESLNIPGADYKGVRSFASEVKHVAASNYLIWSAVTGDPLPAGLNDGAGPQNLKTKAEIIKFLQDSFVLGHRVAALLTPQNMLESDGRSTRIYRATFAVAHAYDHYGQMVEYLRLNGIVPPASRGQSD